MEGLEAREQLSSEMQSHSRLDATFAAHPATAWLEGLQKQRKFIPIAEALSFIGSGHTPYLHDVSQGNVGFITVECIDALNFNDGSLKRITQEQYETEFQSKRVTAGSVVCTIKRRICKGYAFLEEPEQPLAINQDVALLKPKPGWQPAYLAAYLSCRVGQTFADRLKTEQMNPYLSVDNLRTLPICELSSGFQNALTELIQRAGTVKASSRDLYAQAETLLLRELGLEGWQPPEPLAYQSTFRQAWGDGRIDAEHFQPKYAALRDHLESRGAFRLGDRLLEPIRRGISPEYVEEGGDVIVINSQHVGKTQVETESTRKTSQTLLKEGQDKGQVRRGDVLLNSTGYITIGRCQCLLEDVTAVVDNHVAIIRPQPPIDPVYLACFLNSRVGQMQTESNWTGSSGQIELRPDVIADYFVWDATPELQAEVRRKIEEAYWARRQAKGLLETAKRAVEVAIENSEEAGMKVLAE